MINIIRSCVLSLIGLSAVGWLSISLTAFMFAGPSPDSWLTEFFANVIIFTEALESFDVPFSMVSDNLFVLVAQLNTFLIILTFIMSLTWSAGSHYLNVDAPGKAKLYLIHWIIFTAIFLVLVLGLVIFFTQSTTFAASDFIGATGTIIITSVSLIYYFLMYYVGVILGTARFARSSVLFANKLPGNI